VGTRPSAKFLGASRIRARWICAATGVALAGAVAGYAGTASATPQPTIGQVTAQVKQLTTRADQADQQYDQVNAQLTAASTTLKQVNGEVSNDEKQFRTMRADVAQVAAAAYEDGNMTSMAALFTSASPQTVLSQAALLTQLDQSRFTEMSQFIAAARQLASAQAQAKRTEGAIQALRDQARDQAHSITSSLDKKKALLATLTAQEQQTVVQATTPGAGPGATTTAHYTGPTGTQADAAVAFAYKQLGCPYVYGGTGPCNDGFDCSGLVQAAWAAAGISIPRDTYEQWAALPHVSASSIEPGDLLYYNGEGHVAMYVGGGYIIDAPSTGYDVEKIPMSTSWYADNFDGAARP
jgi:peptidoglycan DL-endopeptidase CwlO